MKPRDQILARMYVVLTLFSLAPLLIVAQVVKIHLTDGAELRARGQRQASSFIELPAMRGTILDRHGRSLAVNTARFVLALDPTITGFASVQDVFFDELSKLTGASVAALKRRLAQRSSPQYVVLLRGLTEDQRDRIASWNVPGVLLQPLFARRYNYGSTLAHVLGHVSADGQGLAGLESQYDAFLMGKNGKREVLRDRRGVRKASVEGKVVEPRHGETLVLTIDLIQQTIMEEELQRGVAESGADWGTAIAVDPQSGAILGLANVPTYDPNRLGDYPVAARRNRAITDRIEPGSTFKLITAVTALESGVVAMDDSVETGNGWAVFHGRTMKDTRAHGTITFADVITLSSNVGTAKTASRLDPGTLYQYARNFGFGQPTWIDLPGEVSGVLKQTSAWSGTTLTSMSIGYEIAVTPLQMLMAYAALANGGNLVQPYVVAERRDVTGELLWRAHQDSVRRVFDRATAKKLLPAFERVVEEGTATRARIDGLRIAGKTGTALKAKGGRYSESAYRASFVGFFPVDDPAVAIIVVLDEPKKSGYGGVVAAPIFRRIARRWLTTLPDVARTLSPDVGFPEPPARPAPDVGGMPVRVAEQGMRAAGLRPRVADDVRNEPPEVIQLVREQTPAAADTLRAGARVRLALTEPRAPGAVMPNVRGLSLRQALFWIRSLGADARVEGAGAVQSTWPDAGARLPDTVTLRCR